MGKTCRHIVTAILAGGIVLAGCLPASASNMAFRYQIPLVFAGAGNVGSNWVALPFFNPYGTAAGLCAATGLTSVGIVRATIGMVDPVNGSFLTATCGTAAAATMTLVPGRCVRIRQPNVAGAPTSILLVGSHDPGLTVTIPSAGIGNIGSLWYAIPWHTTAQSVNQICTQQGLTSTGVSRATCLQINPVTGASTPVTCGTVAAGATMPMIGRCCRLREPNGPLSWIPPTY